MIYWTANSVPELRGLEKAEQKQLFAAMQKEGFRRMAKKTVLIHGLLITIVTLPFVILLHHMIQDKFLGAISIGLFVGFLSLSLRRPIMDKGREWLREQGHPKV